MAMYQSCVGSWHGEVYLLIPLMKSPTEKPKAGVILELTFRDAYSLSFAS